MKHATLVFLLREGEILLAMKKRGFGVGRWNGVGGKVEAGETVEQAAIRECQEEVGVKPESLKHVATLDFYFAGDRSHLNQQVLVYTSKNWQGELIETEEMRPQWFNVEDIPYQQMWVDDQYWLPRVLNGEFVTESYYFDGNDQLIVQSA